MENKAEITIKETQSVDKKIIIEIPCYMKSKNEVNYYKVFGKGDFDCLVVSKHSNSLCGGIRNTTVNNAFNNEEIRCTEQEYDEAFEQTFEYLTNLNFK